jgi:acyl carrier protein
MDLREVHERLAEFSGVRQNAGNDEAALLEVALFVEDMLRIVLSDEEICEENLGTHEATERFVRNKLELGEACAEYAE